ncbi:MAG: pyridoxamine 5'-phosphate oxidase family protein [Aquihabitans sp.]
MGRFYDHIPEQLVEWLVAQPVFFVATAPLGDHGHVNLSPKGGDTFRVLDASTVAYLDLTGSGAETTAHLRENGRLTIMFCAFDGKPNIVRLFGQGRTVLPGHADFDDLAARFPTNPGTRGVVHLAVEKVGSSCGYAVPLMQLVDPRTTLDEWAERKSPDELTAYRATKNATSIDGLPAFDPAGAGHE